MSKVALLLSCLLLGACQNETEANQQINTVDEIMECEGSESTCELLINEAVAKLPMELQDKVVDTSERLVIYTGKNEERLKSRGLSGITLYTYQKPTVIFTTAKSHVLFHEIGHAYDMTYLHNGEELPSHSKEWVDAYSTEFISQYGQTSEQEFYAETFSMYFKNPKSLQKLCPKAYALHEKEFKNMK